MASDLLPENQPPDLSAQVPRGSDITNFQPPNTNGGEDLFVQAQKQALVAAGVTDEEGEESEIAKKLRTYVKDAETKYETYGAHIRGTWTRAIRAFQNQHFTGSKYLKDEFRTRSSLFVPKTRSAVRKAMATARAALFSTTDALAITAGNEGDLDSRAAADLVQEIVNYRTDRTSGRNAIKWFLTAMGAVQDATLTGIVVSKQFWKLETKQVGEQPVTEEMKGPDGLPIIDPITGEPIMAEVFEKGEDGVERPVMEPVLKTIVDRPESVLIAPENCIVDAGADWREPAQSAGFFGIRWPMTIDEIKDRQTSPINPWKALPDGVLEAAKSDDNMGGAKGVRSARDGGRDRLDNTNRPEQYQTIWVTEWFIRCEGEDWTFFSLSKGEHFLTDPKPVEKVYPWNFGERPLVMGYGSIESHKIFPMSPAESWQPLQIELNDVSNLILDTTKMNIAPAAVIKRGAQVDLEAMRKRGPGSNILANDPAADVVFQKAPGPDASAWRQREQIATDFDSLAGQFDAGSVQSNRQLNETVGGMQLMSGAANAVGEFDQSVYIETWAEPTISQIVRLCQHYEHDATILGLCGERAKLWQKYGVDQITDQLLEAQVTTRIDIGGGAGDPQQRLARFNMAVQAALPLLKDHPDFLNGTYKLDVEAVMQACFGPVGFRDGGKRFLTAGDPQQPSPLDDAKIESEIDKNESTTALNFAKAKETMANAKIAAFEALADFIGGQQDRQMAQQQHGDTMRAKSAERGDKMRMHSEGRADTKQARLEDRTDAVRARREDHALTRETAAMKGGGKPNGGAPGMGQIAQLVGAQSGEEDIQLLRGDDGVISGVMMGGMKIDFQRGEDGRIAGMNLGQGGEQPQIEMPPPDMGAPALPPRRI